jgi:hypothetical protein
MTEFDDVPLEKWLENRQAYLDDEPHRGRWLSIVALVLLVLAGGAYAWWSYRVRPAPADVRALTEQAVAPAAPSAPAAVPGDNIVLPPLEQTDALVRELVIKLSSHPKVAAWLATDQLLRNFTVTVLSIANGKTPTQHLAKLRPTQKFQTQDTGGSVVIDERSYRRYDAFADAVGALDARGTARLYATLKPRIADAYRELGEPTADFDRTFERAIRELLQTPVVDGPIALSTRTVSYEYADPKLQALPAAQRQLLRMGPRNVRIIQAKLRELAPLLGMTVDVH